MKSTSIAIIIAGIIISASLLIVGSGRLAQESGTQSDTASAQNVTVANNIQTVELNAKGGFTPRVSIARAGIPTILRVNTNGTFDCSSSIRIPSLGISKILPSTGSSELTLGTPALGTLHGTCGMGMYNFEIQFQ